MNFTLINTKSNKAHFHVVKRRQVQQNTVSGSKFVFKRQKGRRNMGLILDERTRCQSGWRMGEMCQWLKSINNWIKLTNRGQDINLNVEWWQLPSWWYGVNLVDMMCWHIKRWDERCARKHIEEVHDWIWPSIEWGDIKSLFHVSGDFINHVLVNRMSQTSWRDLQCLELVLFCSMVSKNNTGEKRRHKRLFFLIFVSHYLTLLLKPSVERSSYHIP